MVASMNSTYTKCGQPPHQTGIGVERQDVPRYQLGPQEVYRSALLIGYIQVDRFILKKLFLFCNFL